MDNTNIDRFTKEIISGSKLELANPNFNKTLMDKISTENRKRIIYTNIKYYSLMFIAIDATIIVLLNLVGIRISDIPLKMSSFSRAFENLSANTGHLLFIYFGVLLAIIFIINKISSAGYKLKDTEIIN
jgi:hypothetical protein